MLDGRRNHYHLGHGQAAPPLCVPAPQSLSGHQALVESACLATESFPAQQMRDTDVQIYGKGSPGRTDDIRFVRPVLSQLSYAPVYNGAGDRHRTRDMLLTRQPLCQLSYSGNMERVAGLEPASLAWKARAHKPLYQTRLSGSGTETRTRMGCPTRSLVSRVCQFHHPGKFIVVPPPGIEPGRPHEHRFLRPACLPVPAWRCIFWCRWRATIPHALSSTSF